MLELLNSGYRATVIDNFDNAFEACHERMKKLAGDKADKITLIKVSTSRVRYPCMRYAWTCLTLPLLCCMLPQSSALRAECRAIYGTLMISTRLWAPTSQYRVTHVLTCSLSADGSSLELHMIPKRRAN